MTKYARRPTVSFRTPHRDCDSLGQPGIYFDSEFEGRQVAVIAVDEVPRGVAVDIRSGGMYAQVKDVPEGWEFQLDTDVSNNTWRTVTAASWKNYIVQVRPREYRYVDVPWYEARGRVNEHGNVIAEVGQDAKGPWYKLLADGRRTYLGVQATEYVRVRV